MILSQITGVKKNLYKWIVPYSIIREYYAGIKRLSIWDFHTLIIHTRNRENECTLSHWQNYLLEYFLYLFIYCMWASFLWFYHAFLQETLNVIIIDCFIEDEMEELMRLQCRHSHLAEKCSDIFAVSSEKNHTVGMISRNCPGWYQGTAQDKSMIWGVLLSRKIENYID